ncbi:AAA family ATPase [Altererythrobacter sp. C41]|nr:AAA family ATPase [Altererythrobacter sp. C41]
MVEATVSVDEDDKTAIKQMIKDEAGAKEINGEIPDTFTLRRADVFDRGDYVRTDRKFSFDIELKKKGDRKFKPLDVDDEKYVYSSLYEFTPSIAYHDSFLFDFPKKIYLTNRPGAGDWVYRKMFEDVLAAGRIPYELDDITKRIRSEKYQKTWLDVLAAWAENDDKLRVQQIIDQASETITTSVFGKWNKIFKEDVGDKEISVQYGVEQGRRFDKEIKSYVESEDHDIYVSLEIKDGTRRFPIQDRSLGFRWFFAFLLFTQFRTKRVDDHPVLFLFDEPAANLHSAAQERLIESFPEIATGNNMLIYSTHSHYMISPDWLEQTFIVTNAADAPDKGIVDAAVIEDEFLDIRAQLYRKFANEHPSDTSYFQPIIDRIEVVPSRFDVSFPSIIVEGKSDFYILRYAALMHDYTSLRLLPGTGSGTFDALIGLGATWGTKFLFLLDSDNAGLKERERYAIDRGARVEAICSLSDCESDLIEIEDLLDESAKEEIKKLLGVSKLTKKLIMRFFQENLARRSVVNLGAGFKRRSKRVLQELEDRLARLPAD